jgi:hypothetical protein
MDTTPVQNGHSYGRLPHGAPLRSPGLPANLANANNQAAPCPADDIAGSDAAVHVVLVVPSEGGRLPEPSPPVKEAPQVDTQHAWHSGALFSVAAVDSAAFQNGVDPAA